LFQPHLEKKDPKHFTITPEIQKGDQYGTSRKEGFRIKGERFEQIVIMTDFMNNEAVMRIRDVMYKIGIQKKLLEMNVETGTPLFVGKKVFEFEPLLLKK